LPPSQYPQAQYRVDPHLSLHFAALVDDEARSTPWARRALVGMAVGGAVAAALAVAYSAHFAAFFHWYREVFHAARVGGTTPAIPANANLPAAIDLPTLLSLVSEIVLLVWQFRAAKTARALGLPARHSPGAGVVFWFVPILDFWFPYQAIRDCLPPGHPERPAVLRFWLAVVGGQWLGLATLVTAAFSRPAGVVLAVATAVAWVVAAGTGQRVVAAAGDAHRQLAGTGETPRPRQ
jgi:hypothetical protein